MTLFLLDTDTVSDALKGRAPSVPERLADLRRDEVGISIITLMELRYGAELYDHNTKRWHEVIDTFVASMPVYSLLPDVAPTCGSVRSFMRKKGQTVIRLIPVLGLLRF